MIRLTAVSNSVIQRPSLTWSLLTLLAVLATPASLPAHEKHQHGEQAKTAESGGSVPVAPKQCKFPNSSLVTSDEERIQFYDDLVKDKTVAISFVYTDCTTICSPIAINMGFLEDLLGDRMGSTVHLISVSIDPVTDTPARLRIWSERFTPGPYWKFVTGKKRVVDDLLKSLNVFTPDYRDHPPIMIVANDKSRDCTYVNGLSSPKKLREVIDRIADGG